MKLKIAIQFFFLMMKIGLFTFGGGYAMIVLLENEFVSKRKWIDKEEFLNMVAISESTPGPIAINSATYIGYKIAGFWGALAGTTGVCIPSFCIIYIISLFLDNVMTFKPVEYAFRGIQVCVIYLIISAGIKTYRSIENSTFNNSIVVLTVVCCLFCSFFAINFSSIFYILVSGCVGLFAYYVFKYGKKEEKK